MQVSWSSPASPLPHDRGSAGVDLPTLPLSQMLILPMGDPARVATDPRRIFE